MQFSFKADFSVISSNVTLFKMNLVAAISRALNIPEDAIVVNSIDSGSIVVSLQVDSSDSTTLGNLVQNDQLAVPYQGQTLTADPGSFVVNPVPTPAPSTSSNNTGVIVGVVVGVGCGIGVILLVLFLVMHRRRRDNRSNLSKNSNISNAKLTPNADYRPNPVFDPAYDELQFSGNYEPVNPASKPAWEPTSGVITNDTYQDGATFHSQGDFFVNPNATDASDEADA